MTSSKLLLDFIHFCESKEISALKSPNSNCSHSKILFQIGENSWELYCDDEYEDLSESSTFMNVFLALRELQIYKEEDDFITWSNQNNGSHLLNYYQTLAKSIIEIESLIGEINPFFSDYDYQMRTGSIIELIELNERKQ